MHGSMTALSDVPVVVSLVRRPTPYVINTTHMDPRDAASRPVDHGAVHSAGRRVRSTVGDRCRLQTARATSAVVAMQVMLTTDRRLSLFIPHSPSVGVPWPNFLVPGKSTLILAVP